MYKNIVKKLKNKNIILEEGLSEKEIHTICETYNIQFPRALENFLKIAVPISEGFYNWRDFSDENIDNIKNMLAYPKKCVYEMINEIEWNDEWGKEPTNEKARTNIIVEKITKAPLLIPVFAHRYMPVMDEENPPIISIHGIDIIYYGENLKEYLMCEFIESPEEMDNVEDMIKIPFWSDLM